MDYCSSCRRHLNGALVCPGCGAYAPDIAPVVTDGRLVSATVAAGATGEAHEAVVGVGAGAVPQNVPRGDLAGASPAPEGRAARRRQRARWKKNQRRAVVATAVALVGGGLTVSAMDQQSGDRAQAATAPQDPGMGAVDEQAAPDTRPTSIRPDTHRSSPASPTHSPAPDRPRRQHTATSLPTVPSSAQPDATAPPLTTRTPAGQQRNTAPAAAETAETAETADTADTTTATQPHVPAAPETTQASPDPTTTTSPTKVCLLVICLG